MPSTLHKRPQPHPWCTSDRIVLPSPQTPQRLLRSLPQKSPVWYPDEQRQLDRRACAYCVSFCPRRLGRRRLHRWPPSLTPYPLPRSDDCEDTSKYASCDLEAVRRWEWGAPARDCGAAHLPQAAVRSLLAGRWVACVGDSIARNLCAGLMRAAGAPASAFFFDRHSDFERELSTCDGCDPVKVTFHWRPYPQNASELLSGWQHEKKPALVVTSVTLWHMLHVGDAEGFKKAMTALGKAAADMVPKLPEVSKPVAVLATGTETHVERMLSAAKRGAMTSAAVDAYNAAVAETGALAPQGVLGMLDMFAMTYGKLKNRSKWCV